MHVCVSVHVHVYVCVMPVNIPFHCLYRVEVERKE